MQSGQSIFAPVQGGCTEPVVCLAFGDFEGSYPRTPSAYVSTTAIIPGEVPKGSTAAGVLHCFSMTKHLLDAGGHHNYPREGGYG